MSILKVCFAGWSKSVAIGFGLIDLSQVLVEKQN